MEIYFQAHAINKQRNYLNPGYVMHKIIKRVHTLHLSACISTEFYLKNISKNMTMLDNAEATVSCKRIFN